MFFHKYFKCILSCLKKSSFDFVNERIHFPYLLKNQTKPKHCLYFTEYFAFKRSAILFVLKELRGDSFHIGNQRRGSKWAISALIVQVSLFSEFLVGRFVVVVVVDGFVGICDAAIIEIRSIIVDFH